MITIYRAICHNEPDIKLLQLGKCWSSFHKSAYPYGCKRALLFYYLYTGQIDTRYIDKEKTMQCNWEYPHEHEIVLMPGIPILITQIEKIRKPCQTLIETYNITYTSKT